MTKTLFWFWKLECDIDLSLVIKRAKRLFGVNLVYESGLVKTTKSLIVGYDNIHLSMSNYILQYSPAWTKPGVEWNEILGEFIKQKCSGMIMNA